MSTGRRLGPVLLAAFGATAAAQPGAPAFMSGAVVGPEHARLAAGSIAPLLRGQGMRIKVDTQPLQRRGNRLPGVDHNGEGQCHISLPGLETVFARFMRPARSALERSRQLELIVLHEAAHCEAAEQGRSAGGADSLTPQADAILSAMTAGVQPAGAATQLVRLGIERQADAKALLLVAHLLLGSAKSAIQVRAALQEFDLYVSELRAMRGNEARMLSAAGVFNDHDTTMRSQGWCTSVLVRMRCLCARCLSPRAPVIWPGC